jgi:PAS domain S-box-containing protein
VTQSPTLSNLFGQGINPTTWATVAVLSFCAILLLPRQFHVTVVENRDVKEVRVARWLFPLYLIAINLFVLPIAAAGLLVLDRGTPADTFVLQLPLALQSDVVALLAFLGGLSAATAMVIVDSVALALMISNGLVMPWLVRRNQAQFGHAARAATDAGRPTDMVSTLLLIRRVSIFVILLLGYLTYLLIEQVQGLAGIGLVSFAAIAQLAPAFFGALFWRYGTAVGAVSGMLVGFAVWFFTLVTPWLVQAGMLAGEFLTAGPFGLTFLAPRSLFFSQMDPLTHGVVWSLAANTLTFVFVSLQRRPSTAEGQAAVLFSVFSAPVPAATGYRTGGLKLEGRPAVTVGELRDTLARYLGQERTDRGFREFEAHTERRLRMDQPVDPQVWAYAERMLTAAVGASTARLIVALRLTRGAMDGATAIDLLDDADSALIDQNERLRAALDKIRDGIAVFDKELRLVTWNQQFRELFELPETYGQFGIHLHDVLVRIAFQKHLPHVQQADFIQMRLADLTAAQGASYFEHMQGGDRILEVRSAAVPQGGFVATVADVTERKQFADELTRANLSLETRIEEATRALTIAKDQATRANADKTRFLATASHDVMQPLTAARLYAASLAERLRESDMAVDASKLDKSLEAVEEILNTLIDIAKMDSGRTAPRLAPFALQDLFDQLKVEFEPLARERKLKLTIVPTTLWVDTDRQMLRRALQNLVSNALKYTTTGGAVVCARARVDGSGMELNVLPPPPRAGLGYVVFQVSDTGVGIPADKHKNIYGEFQRLPETADTVAGLGLGLSVVERVTRALDLHLTLKSEVGRGSTFRLWLPRTLPVAKAEAAPAEPVQTINGLAVPGRGSARFTGLTVLAIDNEPDILRGMEALLVGWGCHVHKVTSTKEALGLLTAQDVVPDLILADYHLDRGTGVDAIRAVRVLLQTYVPAAVVTADPSALVLQDARLVDATVLGKPVKPAALRALISNLVMKQAAE